MSTVLPSLLQRLLTLLGSRRVLLGMALLIVSVESVYALVLRMNDFDVHVRFGSYFLDGEPYRLDHGSISFYPLARTAFDGMLAGLGTYPAKILCFIAAVASLVYIARTWIRLARPLIPLPADRELPAVALTVLTLFPFLIRDLDECGLQILLLAGLTAALDAFQRGRKLVCGLWLGAAIVYKATPLLFLPLLVWKREWKAAGWTALFTVLWSLTPALYLGWNEMVVQQQNWLTMSQSILSKQAAYPSVPGIEEPKIQNVSLRAGIARYLETWPAGHPLNVDHPWFFQFGNLDPVTAKRVVMVAILLLGTLVALRMRKPWVDPPQNWNLLAEWGTACVFVALMSPICWRQHLITALPCAYLAVRSNLAQKMNWRWGAVALVTVIVLCSRREVIGRDLAHVVLTYKLDTLAVLLLSGLALSLPRAVLARPLPRNVATDYPADHPAAGSPLASPTSRAA